ncbi:MAG: hypothetical protein IJV01_07860 [Bacteroidales bacterium]|nr:hypothetical protein [Bacteroidales bacterium]
MTMKHSSLFALTLIALAAAGACTALKEQTPDGDARTYVIRAGAQPLKTVLGPDQRSVRWVESDRVAIISYNSGTGKWGALTDVAPTSIDGTGASFTFSLEAGFEPLYISCPSRVSSAYNTTYGGIRTKADSPLYLVKDNLPLNSQMAEASNAATSIGTISDGAAAMRNAVCLLRITVGVAGVARIILSGNASEAVSGYPVYDPSTLELRAWISPAESLELRPNGVDTFEPGSYYVPFTPQTFASGITLSYANASGASVQKSSSDSYTFLRNKVYDLGATGAVITIEESGDSMFYFQDESDPFSSDDPVRDYVDPSDTLTVDIIPDFSRVGYHYGDDPIPTLPVVRTISVDDVAAALAAGTAPDTTSFIQATLDEVANAGGGALLLRNGEYHVGEVLFIDHSNTVLRGESEAGTVLIADGTRRRPVIWLGTSMEDRVIKESYTTTGDINDQSTTLKMFNPKPSAISIDYSSASFVSEDYVPVGRLWLRVDNPKIFAPGDRVVLIRPATDQWISDIGMDKIDVNLDQIHPTTQWNPADYYSYQERRITYVEGSRIGLDAPVVMSLDRRYSRCIVAHCTWDRITESGVENLTVDISYNPSVTTTKASLSPSYPGGTYCYDEDHAWSTVAVAPAEHCWVRHVTSRHHGLSMVYFRPGSRLCTAEYCTSEDPISIVRGSRRYAFYFTKYSCQNLLQHSSCDHDRHCTVTSSSYGPNVFYDVTCTRAHAEGGPHMGWAMGTLYDNVTTDYGAQVIDRGNSGGNHGWAGTCQVFWNFTATGSYGLAVQSPWTSGCNYAVGCIGRKHPGRSYSANDYYYSRGLSRPDGTWYPARAIESTGGTHVSLPVASPPGDWWPRLTLNSFTHPESLYLSQLEDRHAQGIYLSAAL